jgi:hypothetical protein
MKYVIGSSFTEKDDDDDETLINVKTSDGGLLTCGVERWSIKTLIDPDTTQINFNSISAFTGKTALSS